MHICNAGPAGVCHYKLGVLELLCHGLGLQTSTVMNDRIILYNTYFILFQQLENPKKT